jgi:hypothetical protein
MLDARQGLTRQAVEELRRARQLVLALKDRQTAVLGYWLPDDDRLHAMILPARVHLTAGYRLEDEQPLVIAAPRDDALWWGAVSRLRPRQRIRVEWSIGWGGVSLTVDTPEHLLVSIGRGGPQLSSFQLGRTVGSRIRRGQTIFRPHAAPT